ncbi:uncharacterized protein MKK02DRAFT_42086 [Dioszegia hungarica]|uniref:DUF4267 domain-containing protein n=1 Tax=Dioszegia hungarica TaxID=4972 RepID=A0AA38LX05_9TREE|nr:uncharacterized protein MKK02DRAFT_42086 [Dioszegia hungarica]KAI9639045.1 hypothetical protein MKK02DRAFT_42086 [Dioszegia hungarica]
MSRNLASAIPRPHHTSQASAYAHRPRQVFGCCLAINFIGARFLLAPNVAAEGFGVAVDDARAFTAIKGIRDITSGIVPLVVWRVAGQSASGWAMTAAAVTPIGDALVVISRGGSWGTALGIHGATAAVLIATGQYLAK